MDLSRLSNADLQALAAKRLDLVSDLGLRILSGDIPAKPQEGLGAALIGGGKRFISDIQTGIESLFDPEAAAKRGLERQEELGMRYAPGADLDKVIQAYKQRGLLPAAGEVLSQIPGAITEQAPNIAATLGAARVGAMAGAPFGPLGAVIGGVGGAAAPTLAQLFGSNIQRQAEAGQEISRTKAAAAAAPGAALEVASTFIPLGRSIVGKLLGPEAQKALAKGARDSVENMAQESLTKVLTKGAGVGLLAEIPTEISQQILERFQAGLPLTDDDAFAEYGRSAYGAGLVGGPFGAVGRVGQRSIARGEVEKRQAQIAEQERVAAEEAEKARLTSPEYRLELIGKISEAEDRLKQVEPIAKDKTVDEDVRKEAIDEANELKKQLKEYKASLKGSMKEAGLTPTLAEEIKARPREMPVVDEFGNIVKPKGKQLTEEEYGMQLDAAAKQWDETREKIFALREKEEAELEAKRQKTYEETQQGIQNYLAGLQEVEEADMQETASRVAAQQQRREEDVAQEMTFNRINLVLDNFGLRAAGVSPEVRKVVEDKVNEGVVDRTVTKVLGIQGLEGRTYRDEEANKALPSIQETINKLEEQRVKFTTSKQQLMDNKGQLTPAGYKLVANEAKLNELKKLQGVIQSRVTPETAGEAAAAGLLEAGAQKPEAVAVEIEPGKPSGVYKQKAKEGSQTATGAFTDIVALMDDYRVGRFFGEEASPAQRKLASSKREDLITQSDALRKDVVDGLIQEVAYERQAQGLRPLTRDEAIGLGIRVDEALQEIITRSTALPRGAAIKEVVIEPAQMRGSEIVKAARTARVDPRPLSERQFGNPRRAVEVLAEYIKQTKDDAIQSGKRPVRAGEKPLLKKQYAAPPTDLVKDLDRVLRMENLQPDVRDTLEAARRRMEEGGISAELEELVEEQVGRILRGTDRPFVLERDVTKPGGRRAMAAAGTAELIDEINTQLRFDAEQAQFTGEQMTTVPKGREFREERVQPDLFPETVATERATPGMFQRLQKSATVQRERARIAEEKKEAEKAKSKLDPIAKRIGQLEKEIENLQPLNTANLKFVQGTIADIEKKLGKRAQIRILKDVLGERYDNLSERLNAMDKAVSTAIPKSEADLQADLKAYGKELKSMKAQAKKEEGMRKELEVLKERRTKIIDAARAKRPYVETPAVKLDIQRSAVVAALEKAVSEQRQELTINLQEKNKQITFLQRRIRGMALNMFNKLKTNSEKQEFVKQAEREVLLGIDYLAQGKYDSFAKDSAAGKKFLNAAKKFKPTLFPKEIARINKLVKEVDAIEINAADKLAALDAKVKTEVSRFNVLEKQVAKETEGTPQEKEAKRRASVVRANILKAQEDINKANEENQKQIAKVKKILTLGLDLPGIRVTAERRELARGKGVIRRSKIVPIKTKAEIDAEVAARQRESLDDLRRKARVSSPEAMFNKLKEEEKAAVELAKIKTFQLNEYVKEVNAGKVAKNFPKFKKMSAEVDMAKANVQSIRENLRLLKETQYEPEKEKRQAVRGPIGGEVPFYDKKFTPDQLRKMSGMGLSAFEGGRSYSVDDNIDFRIGDTAGGGIDLEQAETRIKDIIKKLDGQGKTGPDMTRRRLVQAIGASLATPKMPMSLLNAAKTTAFSKEAAYKTWYKASQWLDTALETTFPKNLLSGNKFWDLQAEKVYDAVENLLGEEVAYWIDSDRYTDPDLFEDAVFEKYGNDPTFLPKLTRAFDIAATNIFKELAKQLKTTEQQAQREEKALEKSNALATTTSPIQFIYFPTMKDVTVDILKNMERQGVDIYETQIRGGVKPDGTVFVIGENHTDMTDLEKTIAHEFVGHYSVNGVLGENGMLNLMLKADKAFATKENESGLENLADDLGLRQEYDEAIASTGKFYAEQLAEGKITEKEVRRRAKVKGLSEIIAYTMEKRVDQNFLAKAKRWIQELVGAIRAALKKYGLMDAANLSTSDLFYLMKQANKAFEEGKPMAYRKSDGDIDFRMATPKAAAGYAGFGGPDIIAKQQPSISQIKGNGFGLKFRTFVADQRAVLEEVMNRAKEYQTADGKRLLNAHLAADTEYFMRMLDNKNGVVEGSVVLGTPIIKDLKGRAGQVEKTISHEGMSLLDVFKTIKGSGIGNEAFTTEAISKYLIAYRALKGGLGADVVDIKNRVTEADLKKWLADGEKIPQFVEFRKKYNEYNKGLINFAVQSGALSEKKAQELLKNENYVPYYRVDRNSGFVELLIGNATPIRIGDFKNQPYLEELVGGDGLIMDVFASSLRNTQLIVDMGMTNLAARNAFFTLSEIGLVEKGKTGTGMHSGGGRAGKDIMRFYLNGDEKWARVNTQLKEDLYGDIPTNLLMRSMEGLTIMTPTIVKFMSGPNNLLRKLITLNPRYAVNQVFRESLSAWGTTGANMAPVLSAFGNLKDVVQGKGETFEKLRRASVLTGNITTLSSSDAVAKRLQNIGYGKNGLENVLIKAEELARAGEATTKISLYNAFVKQGLSEREAYLAVLESANMSRRGLSRSIYYTNQLVLFANAGIQGLDILYRAFTGKMPYAQQLQVKRKLAIRGLSVGLMTLAYAALMQDDEAYKNAPPEQRYANWFVRIPGFDEPFRVPIPFEFGLIFKVMFEGLADALMSDQDGKKILKNLGMQTLRSMPGNVTEAGIPIPNAVKPIIELATGVSFFTGRDIVDERLARLDKAQQFRDKTPEVLKAAGPALEMFNLSPAQVEHVIRGYTGSIGVGLLSVLNPLLSSGKEAGPVAKPLSELPILGAFFQPNDAGRVINDAYDTAEELMRRQATYKKLVTDGEYEKAQRYLKEHIVSISMASQAGAFRQRMGEITKAERAIKAAPEAQMSPEKKREELLRLRDIKNKMAEQFKATREQIERQAARP